MNTAHSGVDHHSIMQARVAYSSRSMPHTFEVPSFTLSTGISGPKKLNVRRVIRWLLTAPAERRAVKWYCIMDNILKHSYSAVAFGDIKALETNYIISS